MKLKSIIYSSILMLLISITVSAQSPPAAQQKVNPEEIEKKEAIEKKALLLVDEIIKEITSLKLPENRIRMFALTADALWEKDEKRARVLFKQAINEFAGIIEISTPRTSNPIRESQVAMAIQYRGQLRQEVLQLIASRSPSLARDFLRTTKRSSPMAEPYIENEEIQWELYLASQVVASEPRQALEIAEESLEKEISQELVSLYFKLKAKDGEAAEKLLSGIMKKLRATDFSTDLVSADFTLFLLQTGIHPYAKAQPQLDERIIRELVDLLAVAALRERPDSQASDNEYNGGAGPVLLMRLQSIMGDVEKYAPARAAALKKKIGELNKKIRPDQRALQELEEAMVSGDVETMVNAANKSPEEYREKIYQQAAQKAIEEGDTDRARQIISEHISEPQRTSLLSDVDRRTVWREAGRGKLNDVKRLLSEAQPEDRANLLVQMATAAIGKADKKAVMEMLEEARSLLGDQANDSSELNTLLEIARNYARIDPVKSFEIIEPIVDHLNTLVAAASILDGFEYGRNFREGELISQGPSVLFSLVFQCAKDTTELARADFDRAKAIADRFQRNEVRLMARLYVAQGVLSSRIPALAPVGQRINY